MMTRSIPRQERRNLVGLATVAFAVPVAREPAGGQSADASARVPIEHLDDALLAAMKVGDRTSFSANASETKPAKLLAVFVVDTNETELTTPCRN